jgi:hypothetical protein
MSILQELLDVEKAILGAIEEGADVVGDTVKAGLEGAATAVRQVIDTLGGSDAE